MIAESYTSNYIDLVLKLKQVLYKYIYTEENLNKLCENISNRLEIFNITIEPNFTINIKTKKSCLRRIDNYIHHPSFYYNYISDIFTNFFMQNIDFINIQYINDYGELPSEGLLYYFMNNYAMFVDIHTLLDNIVIIRL